MREQLLAGNLQLPKYEKFITAFGKPMTKLIDQMFQAMWFQYLKDKGSINLTYWSERFADPVVFNQALMALSNAGWITSHSIPARNWAEAKLNENKLLEYLDPTELNKVRAYHKHRKYVLNNEKSTLASATRLNGKVQDTGLVREGFMKAGNTPFQYDVDYMDKYEYPIQKNLTKSMDKIAEIYPELRHDEASYDTISVEMMEYYQNAQAAYTRGDNYNDSRGRAISSCLGKIGNPISCKDFRALLIIPEGK